MVLVSRLIVGYEGSWQGCPCPFVESRDFQVNECEFAGGSWKAAVLTGLAGIKEEDVSRLQC